MFLYFLLIQIAALFGHKKARALVKGQKAQKSVSLDDCRGAVWFHAASVGEFEQARPIIERLRREQPKRKIVVTFFSPSGYEMRKGYETADRVLYLPFATRRKARRFLDALQPSMAIFVKYEFWPAYLHELKKRAIPTYSISAIFRPGQLFFLPWGKQHLKLLKCFTHIFVQDEASRVLLVKYGVTACSVAGDTRFDRMEEVRANQQKLTPQSRRVIEEFVRGAERVLVAGSTWPEDEELLVKYISSPFTQNTKMILVPHEIDEKHLHYIFQLLQGRMLRYSVVNACSQPLANPAVDVLVIDALGLLSSIYPFGHVAYVGGGFGAGIHNTVEAAVYGKPVIFGPNYRHFREAIGLIANGAAHSVSNYEQLESALNHAFERCEEIGAKAALYVKDETGASEKIYGQIFS